MSSVEQEVSRNSAGTVAAGRPVDEEWDAKREELRANGVQYCLSAYTDVHGVPKAKAVPIEHFTRMMRGSELFTGAAIDGLGQGPADDELSVWPDLGAITQLPWEPTVAWAPGYLHFHDEPYPMDSRGVLRRQTARLAEHGLQFNLGIETEFFLVHREGNGIKPNHPKDVLARAAYDVGGLLDNLPFLDELIRYMNQLGWDVHSFDHEDANGQFELDFSYTDVISMADRFVLWRMMTKLLARRHGFEATFMPKPYSDRTGNGGHFNMSMSDLETGENVFADPDDPRGAAFGAVVLPLVLAGMLTGVLMSTLAPAGPARAAAVVASAALTGLAGVALAEGALGILPGPWAANAAALGATVLAIASIVGGLTGLLGQAGIGIATALMVFVGNPWSGMTSARELLPEPAATIGALLPPGAGGALLRSTAFFGGARASGQITVLAVWIAAGLGLIAVAARRHRRTGSPAPADDPLAPG